MRRWILRGLVTARGSHLLDGAWLLLVHEQVPGTVPPSSANRATLPSRARSLADRPQHRGELARVALLRLRQGLEPVGDFDEALLARRLRHARVHVGVLVRLAGDRGLEVERGVADRQIGRGIARLLQEVEVAVR